MRNGLFLDAIQDYSENKYISTPNKQACKLPACLFIFESCPPDRQLLASRSVDGNDRRLLDLSRA